MELIIVLVVMIAITTFPVMMSAKFLGASTSGFFASLLAVILASVCCAYVGDYLADQWISSLASLVLTAIIFSLVLGAGFFQSIGIALLAVVLQLGVLFSLGYLGIGVSA